MLNLVRPLFQIVSTKTVYNINSTWLSTPVEKIKYLLRPISLFTLSKWQHFEEVFILFLSSTFFTFLSSTVDWIFIFSEFFVTYLVPSLINWLFLIDCCVASNRRLILVLSPIALKTLVFTGLSGTVITFHSIYGMQIIRQRMLIHQLFISLKIVLGKTKRAKKLKEDHRL